MKRERISFGAETEDMMMAFLAPLIQLSVAGIQNKMTPKEVSEYFAETVKEFTKKMASMEDIMKE